MTDTIALNAIRAMIAPYPGDMKYKTGECEMTNSKNLYPTVEQWSAEGTLSGLVSFSLDEGTLWVFVENDGGHLQVEVDEDSTDENVEWSGLDFEDSAIAEFQKTVSRGVSDSAALKCDLDKLDAQISNRMWQSFGLNLYKTPEGNLLILMAKMGFEVRFLLDESDSLNLEAELEEQLIKGKLIDDEGYVATVYKFLEGKRTVPFSLSPKGI